MTTSESKAGVPTLLRADAQDSTREVEGGGEAEGTVVTGAMLFWKILQFIKVRVTKIAGDASSFTNNHVIFFNYLSY